MRHKRLAPETLEAVADRFKVLAEPARLSILNALRSGPLSVTTLIDETGLNQANLSKHLQLLYTHGFVERTRSKSWVYYSLADRSVFTLCDIMCGQLDRHVAVKRHAAR
ncbi:MAG TPA: metalloregulator ArsR/SmtB family transcription factor [Vicinamibacterales bacterium]|nr:metalloregulator ArsR/SmtB family transcription factor [Vicinamibacterales bacterium]